MGAHEPTEPLAHRGLVLTLVCAAQFILLIDDTIVNVAIPTIGTDLDFSERSLSWITNAYFLTFGGFLLIGGGLADYFGRRRVFLASLVGFVLASAACGLAPNSGTLIAARAAQGIAGALLSPAALAILLATFRDRGERTRALGVWAALTGLGAATGLLLGGALVDWTDWRWIFLINVPIGILAIAVAPKLIPVDDSSRPTRSPDLAGAALGTVTVLLLVYTVVETDKHGWASLPTVVGLAGVLVLGTGVVLRQRWADVPLIPQMLLRSRPLVLAQGLVLVAAGALFALFFFLTLYMQNLQGWSPLRTGLSAMPFSIGMGAASVVTAKYLATRSPTLPLVLGPTVAAAAMISMSRLDAASSFAAHLMPTLAACGVGLGAAFVAVIHVATGGVGESEGGVASAMVTTCQQIGAAIGIAVTVTLANGHHANRIADGVDPATASADRFSYAFAIQAVLMIAAVHLGALVAWAAYRARLKDAVSPMAAPSESHATQS